MRLQFTASISLLLVSISAPLAAAPDDSSIAKELYSEEFMPSVLYKEGVEALKAKRYAEAKKSLVRLLEVVPQDAETNFLAGLADSGLKNYDSARKYYEAALLADNTLVAAQQELGVTYARLGQWDKGDALLIQLERRNAQCAGTCADASKLQRAVTIVKKALG